MGSFNSYPVPDTTPTEQQQTIFRELNPGEKIMISMLINSIHYFIDCVFIIRLKLKYRLLVLQKGKVLHDGYYPTERGCKNVFGRLFKDKACSEKIKAMWSHFYDPDKRWLKKKNRCLELKRR